MSPLPGRRSESFRYGASPTTSSGNTTNEALQKQVDLYAELAAELEEKLCKRDAEIQTLKNANQALHRECNLQSTRIANLETQCVARSAKVAQLSDTIAAKKTDKVQERLMEKSLEIADLMEETERLRIQKKQLQEEKTKNGKLLLEMSDIIRQLNKIDIQYDKNDKKKDDKKRRLDDSAQKGPLQNVRRKIRAIEEAIHEREALSQENAVQKGKIECLKGENSNLNVQIASLEAVIHEQNQQRLQQQRSNSDSEYTYHTASTSEEGSKEVSYEEFVVESGRSFSAEETEDSAADDSYRRDPRFTQVDKTLSPVTEVDSKQEADSSHDGIDSHSHDSSFSSLETPPSRVKERSRKSITNETIDPEEYKELRRNFDKALDVIERLKEDLSKEQSNDRTKGNHRNPFQKMDLKDALKEIDDLEHQLKDAKDEYKVLYDGFQVLRQRHEEAVASSKKKLADIEKNHEEMQLTSNLAFEEICTMNKALKQQYNDLETEYTLKIEKLEQKLKESRHHGKQRKDDNGKKATILEDELKKSRQEYDAMEAIHRDRIEDMVKEHAKAINAMKKQHSDLQYEYDTFLEIHLKLEEEALQAKMHYKESLLKIRAMEAEARDNKEAADKSEADHREALEQKEAQHQKFLANKDAVIMEWRGKFETIQQEYHSAINAHEQASRKFASDLDYMQKSHQAAIGKMGKLRQNDAINYQKLRREFDAALVNHGKKEQSTIHKYEQAREQYESKMRKYQRKIDEFEDLLVMSKQGNEEQLGKGLKGIQAELRKKVAELESELKQTTERLESKIRSHEKLTQMHEDLKLKFGQSKQRVITTDDQENGANKDEVQVEIKEMAKRLTAEKKSNESLEQKLATFRNKLDQVAKENKELQERVKKQDHELKDSRENQEHIKTIYHELTASYQASLLKIESLLQQREDTSDLCETNEVTEENGEGSKSEQKGGTVMERIKALEERAETVASKSKTQRKSMNNASMNSLFQRDFDMIINKIGVHTSQESLSDGSVVSSVVSSIASSSSNLDERKAIFEAIYNRVDEHAQKMEAMQTKTASTIQVLGGTKAFEMTEIFDVLHHFVQLRVVNSDFLALPRFEATQKDSEMTDKQAQIDADNTNTNTVQSSKEIQDSLFKNECSSNTMEKTESKAPEKQSVNQTNDGSQEIETDTREKESSLLDLKYKDLKEEFHHLKSSSRQIPVPPANIAVPYQTEDEHESCCQQSLAMSSVTGFHPADSMQKHGQIIDQKDNSFKLELLGQESHDDEYHSILSQLEETDELEDIPLLGEDDGDEEFHAIWDMTTASTREKIETVKDKPASVGMSRSEDTISFDITHLSPLVTGDTTTTGESTDTPSSSNMSSERRDEKQVRHSREKPTEEQGQQQQYSDSNNGHRQGERSRSNHSTESINSIQIELRQAKQAAEDARRKQLEREENLRDVIFQYKELQKEHQALIAADGGKTPLSKEGAEEAIVAELEQAKANVTAMKDELERACEKHYQERDHLNTIMDQYQALQEDFLKILSEKQELEKFVYHRPGMGVSQQVSRGPAFHRNGVNIHPDQKMNGGSHSKRIGPDGAVHGTGPHRVGPPRTPPRGSEQNRRDPMVGQSPTTTKRQQNGNGRPVAPPIQRAGPRRPTPAKPGVPLKSSFRKQSPQNTPTRSLQFSPQPQQIVQPPPIQRQRQQPQPRYVSPPQQQLRPPQSEKQQKAQQQYQQQLRVPQQQQSQQQYDQQQRVSQHQQHDRQQRALQQQQQQHQQQHQHQHQQQHQQQHQYHQHDRQQRVQQQQAPPPKQEQQEPVEESPISPTTPTVKKKLGLFRGLSFHGGKKQQPKDQPGISRSFRL